MLNTLKSPKSATAATMTDEMKAERYTKLLNNTLEQVLELYIPNPNPNPSPNTPSKTDTYRTDTTPMKMEPLICDEDTATYFNGMITLSNLSELLCIKLTSNPLSTAIKNNVILYLYNCYKRISSKVTSVPSEQLKKDLLE